MPDDKNKTILVTSMSFSMAHVVRPLEVAKFLREMGYSVVFSGSGKPTQLAQQAGFEVFPLPEWDLNDLIGKLKRGDKDLHPKEQVDAWVRAELDLYEKVKPVAVLDDARITSSISTTVAGLPRIALQNAYQNPYGAKVFTDFKYEGPRGLLEAGDEVPYVETWKEYGLPITESLYQMFEADLILLCDVPEYAPMSLVPPNYHYIGPIIWGHDLENPAWLDDLDPDKPSLYFTMGSTGPQIAFQTAIEILGDTKYQVMMTLGSLVKENGLKPLPHGFFAASYASGDILASRADAMICHGGNGTAYQALRAGIPVISWPTVKDQYLNAHRLSELGLGITISSPKELLNAVEEVLLNPGFREAAEQFSKIMTQYNGPQTAADLIHEYLLVNNGNSDVDPYPSDVRSPNKINQ
jgi:UDP:flavonoid glycosyltransferase YjiC (YdhE family)